MALLQRIKNAFSGSDRRQLLGRTSNRLSYIVVPRRFHAMPIDVTTCPGRAG
ncbi:hypothetical protein [Desulfosporosinus nitroreducens]|uniref:Uncharacterized protein n=1 Tax=Desulfosporosinus nitroreducens TaxID=2018668 RepID=A0ABT8QMP2_9FIRM|nr:hypothetical protein [Desulfosporosinus nitroreducens]MDO0822608.1 hypothetical protein [Desulfosporosinus nitroreducens]